MAKCENCYHYEMCQSLEDCNKIKKINASSCNFYMDKSLIVELPCKVGDTVVGECLGTIQNLTVIGFSIGRMYNQDLGEFEEIDDMFRDELMVHTDNFDGTTGRCPYISFDKTAFISREDAEKALNAQNNV